MTDFYAEDIAIARELLIEFGDTVTIERLRSDGDVPDASKPWRQNAPTETPEAEDAFEAFGVLLPVESRRVERELAHQYNGYFQPKNSAKVIDNQCRIVTPDDRVYEIIAAKRLEPKAGQLILYICEVNEWPS